MDLIRNQIDGAMARSRKLQIGPGQESFALDSGAVVRSPEFARHAGAFLISSKTATMQVDAVGHCLSALVRMQEAGLANAKPKG